jgi:hypothetical protein
MASYDDFKIAFGSLITGGAIKVIENVNLSQPGATPTYVSMHPLGTVLVISGLTFLAVGFIGRLIMRPLKKGAIAEKKENAAEDAEDAK